MFSQHSLSTSSCTAHINLRTLQQNYTTLCSRIPSQGEGMAIIKNDAYGHGLLPVAKALDAVGAPSFGVGTVAEGVALRQAGFTQEILILLGAQSAEDMQLCAQNNLIVHVYNVFSLHLATKVAQAQNPLRIGIKCETGMARLGFAEEDMPELIHIVQQHPHIQVCLASTHISCADMPEKEAMVHEQFHKFARMTAGLKEAFPRMRTSVCNSAASLQYGHLAAEIGADIYRFGIALYGGNPLWGTPWQEKGEGLHEAMRISARVLHVYTAQTGQSIGYGATFVAEKDMRVAVLGIGYADGFSRGLSSPSTVKVCLQNNAAPLCGRVCMGAIMVDVSSIEGVETGQWAWVVDASLNDGAFSMQALAHAWGTIPYECFCLLGDNTRIYQGV